VILSSRDIKVAVSDRTRAAYVRVVIVEDPRLTARSMIEQNETDVDELWLRYFANGGSALHFEFESFLYQVSEPTALDLDLLDLAIEELRSPGKPSEPGH
jgi:hypothetical protein